ncbi:glycerol-3-phosphate dehydrogenase [Vibrio sp. 10N.286.49.C2]|uniref:glycerol-3-phosphate dehydrogenase n=1 Tax=unclassified Vibrio TaxID=2614977 RepID=UPI000C8439E2|nr:MULTISPECIES: glycerol-3-phosphate dehydrogenase [unclassified Vibrio]PMH31497.1 glycerol-3-phosphate dehydrogenase [Vibrio sp. 10N.286.49.C2]PMH50518.1 glycerol-3-phosphate dehydrogenase [Vibrio sp. 10N.286.49.B1]PMH78000.1 glycerol-3-phosphate dehydrogenase [Vibrio sp. 10N.286.48.B7]
MSVSEKTYDLVVIGGGINGVAVAADAAGRGLKVALYEMNDLASATSSASSKLIHGGLRYLEHYEFRLVSEALAEREVLLKNAPHLVSPMRFQLPHRPHLRPAWMIRAGLFLYDTLGKRVSLAGSHGVKFVDQHSPLKPEMKVGFEYSDCAVDDARLVVTNAKLAREKGADINTRAKCIKAQRNSDEWLIDVENTLSGEVTSVRSKALVNAAGPWVDRFFDSQLEMASPRGIRLVKGSHIVVPRMHDGNNAFILQNEDQRIVFVIPYMDNYSLVGTTDVEYQGNPSEVSIDDDEIDYLCDVVNQHFVKSISPADVITTWSGVRPLCDDESDDPQAVTRDYTIELDDQLNDAPLLSIFGGKLTTYRKLGQAAVDKLAPFFPQMGPEWTRTAALPGGNFSNRESLLSEVLNDYSWLQASVAKRWIQAYGTKVYSLLENKQSIEDLGQDFGAGLYQVEVDYLMNAEWAVTAEDVLWRRSKLWLELDETKMAILEDYLNAATLKQRETSLKSVS